MMTAGEYLRSVAEMHGDHVEVDEGLLRPLDLQVSQANPAKAKRVLGWEARYRMPDVARMMVESRREEQAR